MTSQTIEVSQIMYILNISQGIHLCQGYTNICRRAKKGVVVLQALLFESFSNWIDSKDMLYHKKMTYMNVKNVEYRRQCSY